MSDDGQDAQRQRKMMEIVPSNWDKRPLVLASEIKRLLGSVKDEGTDIDSGGMDDNADLWVTVDGREYYINIRPSNNQLLKEGWTREQLGLPPLDSFGSPMPPKEPA